MARSVYWPWPPDSVTSLSYIQVEYRDQVPSLIPLRSFSYNCSLFDHFSIAYPEYSPGFDTHICHLTCALSDIWICFASPHNCVPCGDKRLFSAHVVRNRGYTMAAPLMRDLNVPESPCSSRHPPRWSWSESEVDPAVPEPLPLL